MTKKEEWKYYFNDELVDEETYFKLVEDHKQWTIEQENLSALQNDSYSEKKPRKKKSK